MRDQLTMSEDSKVIAKPGISEEWRMGYVRESGAAGVGQKPRLAQSESGHMFGAALNKACNACLLDFLDVISLRRLRVVSRAENGANTQHLRGWCKWYDFNAAQSARIPPDVMAEMRCNQSLQGLRITPAATSPFTMEALGRFKSRQIQILDLRKAIKSSELPHVLLFLASNSLSLTELNLTNNALTAADAMLLVPAIRHSKILLVLSLKGNALGTKYVGEVLGQMLEENSVLKQLDLSDNFAEEEFEGDAEGFAEGVSKGIHDNRTMTKFDISSNHIHAEGGKSLAAGLKGNQVIKELNISSNFLGKNFNCAPDTSGIIAIADAIPGMGTLSTLVFAGDTYWNDAGEVVIPGPATLEVGMTEADFSNKNLEAADAIIISAWITHKDKGTLTKLDISNSDLPPAVGGDLQHICAAGAIQLTI